MTINDYERDHGLLVKDLGEARPEDEISKSDFNELIRDITNVVAVFWDDREEFLKTNGYKLTRANMIDSSLSAKPKGRSEQ